MKKYTLIITEKPDAANRIAMALDLEGTPKKTACNGVPYYQAYRGGNIVVVPALGHLYTITGKNKGKRDYPVFDYQWVPRHQAERGSSRIRVWLKVISQISKNANEFVDACDFDIEGSIIGYTILKYACCDKEIIAKRMKYSTLTKEELIESYANLLPTLDFPLVEAGLTRHEVDWLYGINLSRALTQAAKDHTGQYITLSTGRVQGPTLKFLEEREKTINCFVPTPYWKITAKIMINNTTFVVEHEKIFENKIEATIVRDTCKKHEGRIERVKFVTFEHPPPEPFDLGTLQSEAYRIFKYTPFRTSNILQHLYLNALISYPRTSSQKLPPSIGYRTILRKLEKDQSYAKNAAEILSKSLLKPNEGKKYDPAHPAIYPTGNLPEKKLSTTEANIFDLVVKRFLSVFGEPAIRRSMNVTINVNGKLFHLNATLTLIEGWLNFYRPYSQLRDTHLPPLIDGEKVNVKSVCLNENFTKPPARYNPRTLLLKMEKEEIGTKATRAATIQTLYERKYLTGSESLFVSDLGFEVIETLSKYCPNIVSPELTRRIEEEMIKIRNGDQTKQNVLRNVTEILKKVTSDLKEKEARIGNLLGQAIETTKFDPITIGACLRCHDGKLVMVRSKKTGKRFAGCTNYFEKKCNATFPLPQMGTVKPLNIVCKICGTPSVKVYLKGRRSWKLCLNPNCPSKGEQK